MPIAISTRTTIGKLAIFLACWTSTTAFTKVHSSAHTPPSQRPSLAAVAASPNSNDSTSSSTLPTKVEVAIAGGGLGGLAVCAALRRRGIDAHVFEAAPQLLRGSTGTGIMISANGFRALESIDGTLPEKMRQRGARIVEQTIRMCDGTTGEQVKKFSMDATSFEEKYGACQYNVGWARAHEVLAGMVPEEAIHCGCRLESYGAVADNTEGDRNGEHDAVEIRFEDGSRVQASLLIGADGVGSAVRRLLVDGAGGASDKTQYSGQILWNAMVPSSAIEPVAHGPGEVEFITCGNDGQAVLAFDAGEEKTSWYLTLSEDMAPPGVRAAMESGSFGGFGRAGVRRELEEVFANYPLALDVLRATPEDQVFERRLADRRALMQWVDVTATGGGRVVVMGDAAHPMVPSLGQGTMLTWEDAADLAACVAGDIGLTKDVPAAVKTFVKRRAKRCAMVQRASAKAYMGAPPPKSYRMMLMLLRMKLGMKGRTERMYGGYKPMQ